MVDADPVLQHHALALPIGLEVRVENGHQRLAVLHPVPLRGLFGRVRQIDHLTEDGLAMWSQRRGPRRDVVSAVRRYVLRQHDLGIGFRGWHNVDILQLVPECQSLCHDPFSLFRCHRMPVIMEQCRFLLEAIDDKVKRTKVLINDVAAVKLQGRHVRADPASHGQGVIDVPARRRAIELDDVVREFASPDGGISGVHNRDDKLTVSVVRGEEVDLLTAHVEFWEGSIAGEDTGHQALQQRPMEMMPGLRRPFDESCCHGESRQRSLASGAGPLGELQICVEEIWLCSTCFIRADVSASRKSFVGCFGRENDADEKEFGWIISTKLRLGKLAMYAGTGREEL